LTAALVLLSVELGSFVLLSVRAGEPVGYADIRAEQRRSADPSPVETNRPSTNWRNSRVGRPPVLHPFIGYVDDPGAELEGDTTGFSSQAADFGFPQNQHDLIRDREHNTVVVAVFGGSFANHLATWTNALWGELRLRDRFERRALRVVSLASGGYKQPQQLMALNYFLALGARFDIVINLDGFNEVALPAADNVPRGVFPFYPRGWVLQVEDLDPQQRLALGELGFLRQRRAQRSAAFARAPWRYSLLAGAIWQVGDDRLGRRISELALRLESGPSAGSTYQGHGPSREYESEELMFDDLARVWARSSMQMHAVCRDLDIEYYHFLQPNQYFPGSKPLTAGELSSAWSRDHPYRPAVERGYPELIVAGGRLRELGVPFHDLSMVFADDRRSLYADACCHLNREGYHAVAGAIAEVVAAGPPFAAAEP
jgi:hypothetical protein